MTEENTDLEDDNAEAPTQEVATIEIPVELAVGIEAYLAEKPIVEALAGWGGLNDALNKAGVKR